MITEPSKATLKKYGLSPDDWWEIVFNQGCKCPICNREFSETLRPCIDHIHVRNYKKMRPEQKRKYIRGICCNYDNRQLLRKGMTLEKSRAIALYLEAFEKKLSSQNS